MRISLRAHFDGRAIVPDEAVDIPLNTPLEVELSIPDAKVESNPDTFQAAMDRLLSRSVRGTSISEESLRRENLYEER